MDIKIPFFHFTAFGFKFKVTLIEVFFITFSGDYGFKLLRLDVYKVLEGKVHWHPYFSGCLLGFLFDTLSWFVDVQVLYLWLAAENIKQLNPLKFSYSITSSFCKAREANG